MAGNKALLDTNVIIYASKQSIDLDKLMAKYDEFYVSIITYMEAYGYAFASAQENALLNELFESLEIVEIDKSIADQAIIYRKNTVKKIKLPDAIILATAKCLGAELVSADWDDFENIDNQVSVVGIADIKK